MLAEIIPLRNLPRAHNTFTYKIPLGLERNFQVGQMVEIPFQKSVIPGVILRLAAGADEEGVKEVGAVINPLAFFGEDQLAMLTKIGAIHGTPLPTLIKMSLPKFRKKKFSGAALTTAPSLPAAKIKKPNYFFYKNQNQHSVHLTENCKNYTLILVPRIQDIDEILALLSKEQRESALLWHSDLGDKEQFTNWLAVKNGEKKIIIATRGGVFLPFCRLDNIIVDYEHDENHKHWDQAPRFNAKDIARMLAERFGAEYCEMSFTPSLEAYYNVHRRGWRAVGFDFASASATTDTYGARPPLIHQSFLDKNNFVPLSAQAEIERVATSDGEEKDIFILLNRKGFASALACRKCGSSEACPVCNLPLSYLGRENLMKCSYCKITRAVPAVCGRCQSPLIRLTGPGIELIAAEMKKMGEKYNYDIITIDSDSAGVFGDKPAIVVGTDAAFASVRWRRTALIVYLGIDREIFMPEFNATEKVWHKIREIQFRKNADAELILATNQTDHPIFKSLLEPDRLYRLDLNARQKAGYPPYHKIVKFFYGNSSQKIAKNEALKLADTLHPELTKLKNGSILIDPIEMHPFYYRRRYWYALIAKFPGEMADFEIAKINRVVPDHWKIDFNPISLLSP